jgi:hypothetical protein
LQKQLHFANERILTLEGEKESLEGEVERLTKKCEGISEFVNKEMEVVSEFEYLVFFLLIEYFADFFSVFSYNFYLFSLSLSRPMRVCIKN